MLFRSIGAVALYASFLLGAAHFWLGYAALVIAGAAMYAPYGPFFAMIADYLPRNVAGGAMALINGMGALGSFVGAYLVGYLNATTGSPSASYLLMSAAVLIASILTLTVNPAHSSGSVAATAAQPQSVSGP